MSYSPAMAMMRTGIIFLTVTLTAVGCGGSETATTASEPLQTTVSSTSTSITVAATTTTQPTSTAPPTAVAAANLRASTRLAIDDCIDRLPTLPFYFGDSSLVYSVLDDCKAVVVSIEEDGPWQPESAEHQFMEQLADFLLQVDPIATALVAGGTTDVPPELIGDGGELSYGRVNRWIRDWVDSIQPLLDQLG
jgi:hypothetical protein